MAVDPKKRQKQLARKAAKRKKALEVKKASHPGGLSSARVPAMAAEAPIYRCLAPRELYEFGIGNIIFSRRLPNGMIAASFLLVDIFCLGVKDAFFQVLPMDEFEAYVARIGRNESPEEIRPECARKLVEGAVDYARDLGLEPHPDYQGARKIFGSVDAGSCSEEFTYGKDGKPFFVAGPNDTPAKIRRVMETLTNRLGPDGFHFLSPLEDEDEF